MHHFIFHNSAIDIFSTKLINFHEECVDELVMTGVGSLDDDIQDVKMTRMGNSMKYLRRVIGGLINTPALFHIWCEDEDKNKWTECTISYILDDELVEDYYMLHKICNYPNTGSALYSIWKLKLIIPEYINNFWRAEER